MHKHAALAAILALLTVKERPISYMETHAGRGRYDLSDGAALKTGEALRGVAMTDRADHPYWKAIDAVRAESGESMYPGSPKLAEALLRPQDRMTLMELHAVEHMGLSQIMGEGREGGPAVAIHRRNGHEGLRALTPPKPLRGLALIDPSYEVKTEYDETAALALEVWARWPQGVIMVWYPILPAGRHTALIGPVMAVAQEAALVDEVRFRRPPARGMQGSGLLFLNPPHGAKEALEGIREMCLRVFAPAYVPARG